MGKPIRHGMPLTTRWGESNGKRASIMLPRKCVVGGWTGLRGEESMAVFRYRESRAESRYPSRLKELLKAGPARFAGFVQLPPNVVGIGTDDGRHSEVPHNPP